MMLLRPFGYFIFTFLFLAVNASCQPQKNDINIRTNILSWLEPNAGGPVLGMEYFFSSKFSFGTDAGIIFYNPLNTGDNNLGNPLGYRIKPEIRYYLYHKTKDDPTRLFFAIEGHYLKIKTVNYNELPIADNTGTIIYYYIGGFNEYKEVIGLNTKAGIQFQRFFHHRLMMELYAGLGIKQKTFTHKNLPAGAVVEQRQLNRLLLNTDVDGSYPNLAAGFKLVYKIKT